MEPMEFLYQNPEIELSEKDTKILLYVNGGIAFIVILALLALAVMK